MSERCVEVTVYDNTMWDSLGQGAVDDALMRCRNKGSWTMTAPDGHRVARLTLCEEHH